MLFAGLNQAVFKIQDTLPGAQPGLYFLGVKRFGQIIVGARFQALNDILLGLFRAEQDQAGVGLVLSGAQFAAYFSPVKTSSSPLLSNNK